MTQAWIRLLNSGSEGYCSFLKNKKIKDNDDNNKASGIVTFKEEMPILLFSLTWFLEHYNLPASILPLGWVEQGFVFVSCPRLWFLPDPLAAALHPKIHASSVTAPLLPCKWECGPWLVWWVASMNTLCQILIIWADICEKGKPFPWES